MIHGERDEVVLCEIGIRFAKGLKEKGVKGEIVVRENTGRHIFDGALTPGDEGRERWVRSGYGFLFGCL